MAAPVLLHVRGPRMLTGAEAERPVQVVASATRADLPPDADPTADSVRGDPQRELDGQAAAATHRCRVAC